MQKVDKAEFYKFVELVNIFPIYASIKFVNNRYAVSVWEDTARNARGKTISDSHGVDPTEYWVKA